MEVLVLRVQFWFKQTQIGYQITNIIQMNYNTSSSSYPRLDFLDEVLTYAYL